MKKALLTGIAALLLATGTAHADELPSFKIDGGYCKEWVTDFQTFYKRGFCASGDGASFTSTTYENMRDVSCKFIEIKKITAIIYRIRADCVESHTAISNQFIVLFDLEILRRGLLITYLSEG
jgi:hypothetical protein